MSKESDNSVKIEIESSETEKSDENRPAVEEKNSDKEQVDKQEMAADKEQSATGVQDAASEYVDQLLRAQAELQNYKRRTEQRLQQWRENASKELLEKILPVVDDFDILFNHHKNDDEKVSVQGVRMIYNKLMAVLNELGLAAIDAQGEPFDPNIHEAVMAEETDDVEEGHIVKVWQRGYMYNDTLLRPAKVITAIAKNKDGKDGE